MWLSPRSAAEPHESGPGPGAWLVTTECPMIERLPWAGAAPTRDLRLHEQPETCRAARAPVQGRGGVGSVAREAARHVARSVAAHREGWSDRRDGLVRRGARRRALLRVDRRAEEECDDATWLQKFTPRGKRSIWSRIDRDKVQRLIESGRMQAPGLAAVERAKASGQWDAAYDSHRTAGVPEDLQRALDAHPKARAFFTTLNSANRQG
jgi:hypothetical protein